MINLKALAFLGSDERDVYRMFLLGTEQGIVMNPDLAICSIVHWIVFAAHQTDDLPAFFNLTQYSKCKRLMDRVDGLGKRLEGGGYERIKTYLTVVYVIYKKWRRFVWC